MSICSSGSRASATIPPGLTAGPDGHLSRLLAVHSASASSPRQPRRARAVLERLIPRLKIAPRCSFEQPFLVVSGDLRTYKIHLGSGNILMEPNDQYLCIVPKRPEIGPDELHLLPFEGDGTLSVILSKALLLANDKQITDRTITAQIRR